MSNREVEVKFKLLNPDCVRKTLDNVGQLLFENEIQKDSYFRPQHRKFADVFPVPEWFRVRETDTSSSINYKYFDTAGGNKPISCTELELKIDDSKTFIKILECLDFNQVVVVEKMRSVWMYDKVEISIDTITNFGAFIEFEKKGYFESDSMFVEYCHSFISDLQIQIGEQIETGYPILILKSLQSKE